MIACLDIGGSTIKAARANAPDGVGPPAIRPTPAGDFDAFVATIDGLIADLELPAGAPAAVAIAGVVDPDSERITAAKIPCIDGRRLASDLSERLRRPVAVVNDADAFALAEATVGAGRGRRIVFGAILGTGVGGGLVIDGRLVSGAGGYAGEWGHGPILAQSVGSPAVSIPRFACGCGRSGCVDTVGGARGLERLHAHLWGRSATSQAIVEAWSAGEPDARRTLDLWTDLVADPLALSVNVTGADIVPVGGGLGRVEQLIARLDTAVRRRILRDSPRPVVVPAAAGPQPGLVGAAILAFRSLRP